MTTRAERDTGTTSLALLGRGTSASANSGSAARTRVILVLWFLALINYVDRVAMGFAAPSIMTSLAISTSQFGLVLSSFGVGYGVANIPAGLIADRWGTRLLMIFAPLLWASFTGMTGLVSSLIGFLAARFCLGLAEGLFEPLIYKTIGDSFAMKQRSAVVAICLSAPALGVALAGPVVRGLINSIGWRGMFLVLTAPALLASALSFLLLPRTQLKAQSVESRQHREWTDLRHVLRQKSLWILGMSKFGADIAQAGYLSWMPTYLAMERGLDIKSKSHLTFIPFLFPLVGLILGGLLGSGKLFRWRAHVVAVSYVAAALLLFYAYHATSVPQAIVGLSGAAMFLFGTMGPKGSTVIDLAPPRSRGSFVACYNMAGVVGTVSGPALIGWIVGATGAFAGGFVLMVSALLLASVCMIMLVPMLRRVAAEGPSPPTSS